MNNSKLEAVKNMDHFDFTKWACELMLGKVNFTSRNNGVDGVVSTISSNPEFHGAPIQVKQIKNVGVFEIGFFTHALMCMQKKVGFFIAFSFTEVAEKTISELNQEGTIKIHLLTVDEMIGKTFEEITANLEDATSTNI